LYVHKDSTNQASVSLLHIYNESILGVCRFFITNA
jgi:hypothetical protein